MLRASDHVRFTAGAGSARRQVPEVEAPDEKGGDEALAKELSSKVVTPAK